MFDSFCRKLCTFTSVQRCLNYSIDSSPHSHRFRDVVWIIPSTAVHIHISSEIFDLFHQQLCTFTSVQCCLNYSIDSCPQSHQFRYFLFIPSTTIAHSHQSNVVWFIPSTALLIHISSVLFDLFHRQLSIYTSFQRCLIYSIDSSAHPHQFRDAGRPWGVELRLYDLRARHDSGQGRYDVTLLQ